MWQYLLPNMKPFQRKSIAADDMHTQSAMPLFVQRTTAHFPHQPVCTVVGTDRVGNHVSSLVTVSCFFCVTCCKLLMLVKLKCP